MSCEHFIYSAQSALGTWVTPARAIPVESADIQHAREIIDLGVTGDCRAPYVHVLGAKPVTFALVMPFWTVNVATLLNTVMTDNAITEVTSPTVYDHGMLFDDTAMLGSISGQVKYKSDLGRNVLGATPNGLTISAAIKEPAKLAFDFIAKDEALAAGTWDFDGSASPVLVASPTYGTLRRPLMFYDASVTMGGTPAINGTTQKVSIGSGTAYTKVNSIEFAINNNLDADGFGLVADPTVQELGPGSREIKVTLEMSWTDYATTFYTNARAGTAMAVALELVGPIIGATVSKYEAHIFAPSVFFDPVNLPDISGDKSRKKIQVTGTAQRDSVTGVDFGMWVQTGEATI
jgi:hypothetical protein